MPREGVVSPALWEERNGSVRHLERLDLGPTKEDALGDQTPGPGP